ncbi:hypothetical protein D3C80_1683650 [compost metagenome]
MRIPKARSDINIIMRRLFKLKRPLVQGTLSDEALAYIKVLLKTVLGISGIKGTCQQPVRFMKVFKV